MTKRKNAPPPMTIQSSVRERFSFSGIRSTSLARFLLRCGLQAGQHGQDLSTVLVGIYVSKDASDLAVGIDDKGVSLGEFDDGQVHDGPVCGRDFGVFVGERFESEAFLGAKTFV